MFIFDAIVLRKVHIKESKNIIYLFSRDFGKISAWIKESKLKYPIDIGNIVNFGVTLKGNINNVDSYKIKKTIDYNGLNYESISNILNLLYYIYSLAPEGIPSEIMYDDYINNMKYFEENETNKKITEFFKMKLIINSGIGININDMKKSVNFEKIYNFIKTNKLEKVLKVSGIEESLINEIKTYNNNSYNLFIN
ncbi:recombination protein O N-terminal domain-containing protein [Candidatus Gracilibacteria bacterium]|nr:recombination protein O N-terminal domain-containing protein [Candidatus Gracilibacteria bacterium]